MTTAYRGLSSLEFSLFRPPGHSFIFLEGAIFEEAWAKTWQTAIDAWGQAWQNCTGDASGRPSAALR
eukprot:102823-Rhodomonas_salina.3